MKRLFWVGLLGSLTAGCLSKRVHGPEEQRSTLAEVPVVVSHLGLEGVTSVSFQSSGPGDESFQQKDISDEKSLSLKLIPGKWRFAFEYKKADEVLASSALCFEGDLENSPIFELVPGANDVTVKVCKPDGTVETVGTAATKVRAVLGDNSSCFKEETPRSFAEDSVLDDVHCEKIAGNSDTKFELLSWLPVIEEGQYKFQGIVEGDAAGKEGCVFSAVASILPNEANSENSKCEFGNEELEAFETLTEKRSSGKTFKGFVLENKDCDSKYFDHKSIKKSGQQIHGLNVQIYVQCEGDSSPKSIEGLVVKPEEN